MSFSQPDTPLLTPSTPARRSTYREAEPLPFGNGFFRVAPKWITDRFNDHWSNGSQTGQAFCSVAGLLCHGPIDGVRCILQSGDTVALLDVTRPDNPLDPNYYSTPFQYGGTDSQIGITNKGRIYWGREDQPVDSWLVSTTGQDHPAYRGQAYVIFERIHCGQITANSKARPALPSVEFSILRLPTPTIDSGIRYPASLTPAKFRGVNIVSALYDYLTNTRGGLGLVDALDDDDWAAKATALENGDKPAGGAYGDQLWISPIHASNDEFGKSVDEYVSYLDGFLYTRNGKLCIDWFPNDGVTPSDLPEVSHHDITEVLELNTATFAETPTQIVVSGLEAISDGPDLSEAAETHPVPFVREVTGGENRVEKLERPWFTYRDTLSAYASRVASTRTVPAQDGRYVQSPDRAVKADGTPIRPGDLVLLNWQPQSLLVVARITERMEGEKGIEYTWERERGTTPLPYQAPVDPREDYSLPSPTAPTADDWDVVNAPAGLAGLGVVAFCRRTQNTVSGCRLHYDPTGLWDEAATPLGEQGFAVRVALVGDIDDEDDTATIISTDEDASAVLGSGANSTEQNDDVLLLQIGGEWISVGAVSSVATNTYSIGLARGRLGSTAVGHPDDAVGWLIRKNRLTLYQSANFIDGESGYFKMGTYNPLADSPLSAVKELVLAENSSADTNGYTITLSSYAFVVGTTADGTIGPDQLGATGFVRAKVTVQRGKTDLTAVASAPTSGQFSIAVTTGVATTATKETNDTVRCDTLTADQGVVNINVTVAAAFTVKKTFSVVKAKSGANGTSGQRGFLHFYVTGSSWSDSAADAAITAQGYTKIILDQVTIFDDDGFAATKYWAGTTGWQTLGQVINGNLFVRGTVGAYAMAADSIDGNNIVANAELRAPKIVGDGVIITSNTGMRYEDDNHVFTITGGEANGESHGAQVDLAGNGLTGGLAGVLNLSAGNVSTGNIRFRTGGAERGVIGNNGTLTWNHPIVGTTLTATSSSRRYKKNIRTMNGDAALDLLMRIRAVWYDERKRRKGHRPSKNMPGVIAEELNRLVAAVVLKDDKGRPDAVDYSRLMGIVIAAQQASTNRANALEKQVRQMQRELRKLMARKCYTKATSSCNGRGRKSSVKSAA